MLYLDYMYLFLSHPRTSIRTHIPVNAYQPILPSFLSIYTQYIAIDGPEPGVDIAIDDFKMERLGSQYFPTTDLCTDLIQNGDASMSPTHAYPFYSPDALARIQVVTEGTNSFFRLTDRRYIWSSIRQDISLACLQPATAYRVSFDVRTATPTRVRIRVAYMTKKEDGVTNQWNQFTVATCTTAANNAWTTCSGVSTLYRPNLEETSQVFLDAQFLDSATMSADYDNFEIAFESGPAGSFVVPAAGVDTCWTPGSKVLISSDTTYPTDDEIATLESVTRVGDTAVLSFQESVAARSSEDGDGFPVELVLMERNIRFESDSDELGEGGHLAVWQTPQAMVLDGVEMYKFGQQGTLGRYVSIPQLDSSSGVGCVLI